MPYSRSDILNQNTQDFPNNNSGQITPAILRDFNANYVNSVVFIGDPTVSASYAATASIATSASYANTATLADTASFFSGTVISASYAVSASNAASSSNALFAQTASYFNGSVISASYAASASNAISASKAVSSSYANTATTASFVASVISASYAASASNSLFAQTASYFNTSSIQTQVTNLQAATGGFATLTGSNVFTGNLNTFQNAVTMSNVQVTGTASVKFLYVEYQSSSIIFSSGSNTLGDAANDTQTLWGTVVLPTGPLVVTGSATATLGFTGSLQGTASYATNSTSASYAASASNALNSQTASYYGGSVTSASYAASASNALNAQTASYFNGSVISASYAASASNALAAATATSASYALTASFAANSTPAFPFTGSAQITGSLNVTGSITAIGVTNGMTGSLVLNQQSGLNLFTSIQNVATQRNMQQYVTESLQTNQIGGANIYMGYAGTTATGSLVVSGSANYINVTTLMTNANANAGAKSGFAGSRNFIFAVPTLPTASFNDPQWVSINNSWIGAAPSITNNYAGVINTVSITNAFVNSAITANLRSGSLVISNANVNWTTTLNANQSGSSNTISNAYLAGAGILTINQFDYTGSSTGSNGTINIASSGFYGGNAHTYYIPSGSQFSSGIKNSTIVGETLIVTGSIAGSGMGAGIFGTYNTNDGRINHLDHIRFAVGTGTGPSARATALYVSASGLTVIQNNLLVTGSSTFSGSLTLTGSLNATSITGSHLGTSSYADNATSASYAISSSNALFAQTASYYGGSVVSASYAVSASNALNAQTASYFNGSVVSASYATNSTSASYAVNATTASYATTAQTLLGSVTSASYALTASFALNGGGGAAFPYTGSAIISGSLGVTGSTRGNIVTVTAVSNTASIDLSKANAFLFYATATSTTGSFLTLTNMPTGSNQKFSLLISQSVTGGSNVFFSNDFQFPSASQYTVSTNVGAEDVLTFETYTY